MIVDPKNVRIERIGSNIRFLYKGEITEEDAKRLQGELGYAYAGYGFYLFSVNTHYIEGEPELVTSWECSSSCD